MYVCMYIQYSLNHAQVIHERLLLKILAAPMKFFDTTPIGVNVIGIVLNLQSEIPVYINLLCH